MSRKSQDERYFINKLEHNADKLARAEEEYVLEQSKLWEQRFSSSMSKTNALLGLQYSFISFDEFVYPDPASLQEATDLFNSLKNKRKTPVKSLALLSDEVQKTAFGL